MAAVVFVHGVGQQVKGSDVLHAQVSPALASGVALAGGTIDRDQLFCAFYGDLFRPTAEYLAPDPLLTAHDLTGSEHDVLLAWWRRAAEVDDAVVPPGTEVLGRSPRWVVQALRALSRSRFFAGLAERALIGDLRQVRRYFEEPEIRASAVDRVLTCLGPDTKVVVAHSLGTVVAYEALSRHEGDVAFVTLGSPLGLPHLIHERLEPPPHWPDSVRSWTNVVDAGDVVAVVEDLRPLFGTRITQVRVHNGAKAHDAGPYLTDRATGAAVVEALRG